MNRPANCVVTQHCREERRLAAAINNKRCNCTCVSHAILPALSSLLPRAPAPKLQGLRGIQSQGPAPWWGGAWAPALAGCCHRGQLARRTEPVPGLSARPRSQGVMAAPAERKHRQVLGRQLLSLGASRGDNAVLEPAWPPGFGHVTSPH